MNQLLLLLLLTLVYPSLSLYVPVKGGHIGKKTEGELNTQQSSISNKQETENGNQRINIDLSQSSDGISEKDQKNSFESILKDREQKLSKEHNHKDITFSDNQQHEREVNTQNHNSTNTHEENHHSKDAQGERHVHTKTIENSRQENVVIREQTISGGDIISNSPNQSKVEDQLKILLTDDQNIRKIGEDENNKKINEEVASHLVHSSKFHHSLPDNINTEHHKTDLKLEQHDHEKDLHRHNHVVINPPITPTTIQTSLSIDSIADVNQKSEAPDFTTQIKVTDQNSEDVKHTIEQDKTGQEIDQIPPYTPPIIDFHEITSDNEDSIISGILKNEESGNSQRKLDEEIERKQVEIKPEIPIILEEKEKIPLETEQEQKNVNFRDSAKGSKKHEEDHHFKHFDHKHISPLDMHYHGYDFDSSEGFRDSDSDEPDFDYHPYDDYHYHHHHHYEPSHNFHKRFMFIHS